MHSISGLFLWSEIPKLKFQIPNLIKVKIAAIGIWDFNFGIFIKVLSKKKPPLKSDGFMLSRRRDSNPRPADYKSAALAN